jgi:hypothetical protein
MNRRKLFKTIFGTIAGSVLSPVVKALPKPPVVGDFSKIMIPMIKRTFPELLMKDLVDIQPMSGPVGLAFHMNYVYTPKKWSLEWWKEKFNINTKHDKQRSKTNLGKF